ANRQLDFATQGDLPAVVAKAGGLDTRLLLADSLLSSNYLVVPVDSPAKTLADLKGKRIGLFKGTNLHLATLRALRHEGFRERAFRHVNMDFATMAAAPASKDIDGAWLAQTAFDMEAAGIGRIIYDSRAGLFKGTTLHLALRAALGHERSLERAFRPVNLHFATMAAAPAAKDIDGAWLAQPACVREAAGIARIIYDSRAVDPRLTRQS